jgi:hypothetical protein
MVTLALSRQSWEPERFEVGIGKRDTLGFGVGEGLGTSVVAVLLASIGCTPSAKRPKAHTDPANG